MRDRIDGLGGSSTRTADATVCLPSASDSPQNSVPSAGRACLVPERRRMRAAQQPVRGIERRLERAGFDKLVELGVQRFGHVGGHQELEAHASVDAESG